MKGDFTSFFAWTFLSFLALCGTIHFNDFFLSLKYLLQKWLDYKMKWKPEDYGGVEMLYVPSQHIWLPDIVLFNK